MGTRTSIFALLLILSILAAPAASWAGDETAGTIESSVGKVTVERTDGKVLPAAEDLPLYPGDRIVTGEDGRVWIILAEKGRLVLYEDSHLTLDDIASSEVEERYSVLRLLVGHLLAKIERVLGEREGLELHTPTAVVGVRGTEFETVVARDVTSVVSVDEGTVEIDVDGGRLLLKQGTMTEVEMGAAPAPAARPIPEKRIDWRAWRRERFEDLPKRLPMIAPRLRARFEKAALHARGVVEDLEKSRAQVMWAIKAVRSSRRSDNVSNLSQDKYRLGMRVSLYKGGVAKFRRAASRVKVMGRASKRLKRFAESKKEQFSAQDYDAITAELLAVAKMRPGLKRELKGAAKGIRKTFFELRKLRKEMKRKDF